MSSTPSDWYVNLWSRWTRWRFREDFDQVAAFCLFVGYPRSGHSIVGAMLNAHRHAVIAHELQIHPLILAGCDRDTLYAQILAKAAWFNLRGNTSNYAYQVPHQWQGRFEQLRVVGNKRGGVAALAIGQHPDLLDRLVSTVGVPLRLVHIVRNPFDNIAAISLWHRIPLEEAVAFYFRHCETTGPLTADDRPDLLTLHHETLLEEPESTLSRLCAFVGLQADDQYLEDCASVMNPTPSYTRTRVSWSPALISVVLQKARAYPFLAQYGYDIPAESQSVGRARRRRSQAAPALWPRIVRRVMPTERRPAAFGDASPIGTAAGMNTRLISDYWNEAARQVRRSGPMDAWYTYMRGVYSTLIKEWLPAEQRGPRLKTDLFEEGISRSHPLADLGVRCIGLDVSLDVARAARETLRGTQASCIVADLRGMPFREGSLDGILSGSSLDHFSDAADVSAGLAELGRVLAPGGTLVLTLDNPHNPVVWARNHLPFALLRTLKLVPSYVGVTLGRREALQAIEKAGLRVQETRAVAHAPRAPAIWLVKLFERAGLRTIRIDSLMSAFEGLGRLPTRYLTGYYLAFRVMKPGAAPQASTEGVNRPN